MNALDSSVVNVALPNIQRDLHFSQSNLTWVVDAYSIAFGSFLLVAGRLGDLIGRKKVFLSGVSLFTASSLVCAVAGSQGILIAARFLQGMGGAVSSSVIIAIIVTEFSGPAERAKAMSAYMFVTVGGGSLGLLAGGVLTQAANWHWIFVINLPIGAATLVLGVVLLEENVGLGLGRGVDVTGSLLVTAALIIGTYGIVKASDYGWLSARTLGFGGAAILLLAAFFVLESRRANPIMPLRILRIRSLTASSAVRGCVFIAMYAVLFFGALYLEHVLAYNPLGTGVAFLPMTIVVGGLSMGITSRLLVRFGPMKLIVPGLTAIVAGLLLIARAGEHATYFPDLLPAFILIGIGMGSSMVPVLSVAMTDVPKPDAGLASGIVNVSIWLCSSIGLAVLGTISASRTKTLASQGHSTTAALLGGYHLAFLVAAGCAALGLLVAVVLLRTPAKEIAAAARSSASDVADPAPVRNVAPAVQGRSG
jgi:EmrB/QacA subfamily drug resistance transporter